MGKEKGSFRGGNIVKEYKDQVDFILKMYRMKEIGGAKLYLVDAEGIEKLKEIQSKYDTSANNVEGLSKRAKNEFSKVLKIINPDNPATQYSVGIRGKHRQINDQEKIFGDDGKALETEFAIWKNQYLKAMEQKAIELDLDQKDMDNLRDKVNGEIATAEGDLKYILENRDQLVVRIAGLLHQKSYPYIQYIINVDTDGKRVRKKINEHLSIKAVNAFFYIPTYYRDDMKIMDFIKHADNPFGDVFYMQKPPKEED